MPSLLQLISQVRAWRVWRALRRPRFAVRPDVVAMTDARQPIRRDVSIHGVRVYSLCGSCGVHLGASATLCEPCARSRPMPRA